MSQVSPFLTVVCTVCLVAMLVSGAMGLYRMIIGPQAADRAVALDVLASVFIGIICILSITWKSSVYYDAIWILTLVGFIGSVAIAKYMEKGRVI
jgi:multisubunit Na+/H+ antiporter MnhF subunit